MNIGAPETLTNVVEVTEAQFNEYFDIVDYIREIHHDAIVYTRCYDKKDVGYAYHNGRFFLVKNGRRY